MKKMEYLAGFRIHFNSFIKFGAKRHTIVKYLAITLQLIIFVLLF